MTQPLSVIMAKQIELSFETYLEELDALDAALGAHLLDTALTPASGPAVARRGSPAWWRAQVTAWCALGSTVECFDPEAIGSAAMAAEQMEDYLLMPWIRSLLTAGAAVRFPDRPAA